MISVTSILPYQALRGQSVRVYLDESDSSILSSLYEGQIVEINSTNVLGYIVSVDEYGRSFLISPIQPNFTLESESTPGYFDAGEIVYIDGQLNLLLQEDDYALLQEDGGAILLEN